MKNNMVTIVSTKVLTEGQSSGLLSAGIRLIAYDFIGIKNVSMWLSLPYDLLIVTSQNAVRSLLAYEGVEAVKETPVLCVGKQTEKLLALNGFKVLYSSDYAIELIAYIKEHWEELKGYKKVVFLAGSNRLDTLPNFFKERRWEVEEVLAYETVLTPVVIEEKVDGILFFSPSGVESYCKSNTVGTEKVYCIGATTAEVARRYWEEVVVSNEPSIEGVIRLVEGSGERL